MLKPRGRRPGGPGRKEEKDRGVGSVPLGSSVCTAHACRPGVSVPCVCPESGPTVSNPADRKVDPRIRKNRIATRWRCEHGNTHNKASRVLVKVRPCWSPAPPGYYGLQQNRETGSSPAPRSVIQKYSRSKCTINVSTKLVTSSKATRSC